MTPMMPKIRVLVVEDNADDYELLVYALKRGGFDVEALRVCTEPEMRAAVGSGAWDVVCVDWVLPAFSAPDALRMLREAGNMPPCIVVSGSRGEDIAVLAMKLGARDFLPKDQIESLPHSVRRELLFDDHQDEKP